MRVDTFEQAKRLLRDRTRSSQKTGKKLRRANGLLNDFIAFAHDLPDHQRPAQLIERARLHLHSADAEATQIQE